MPRKHLSRERLIEIGRKGGKATYRKLGRKFFRKISLQRKKFGGGRPRKQKPEEVLVA
jgi:general stress protein YciG